MNEKYKVIVLDFDGVLVDSLKMSYDLMTENIPELSFDEYRNLFNKNIYHSLATLQKDSMEDKLHFFKNKFLSEKERLIEGCDLANGMQNLLINIKRSGYFIAINSSSSEKTIKKYLEINHLNDVVDAVYGIDTSSSKIEKFSYIFVRFGVSPNECLFITDTIGDVLEANRSGVDTLAVTWGLHKKENFVGAPIVATADSPEELLQYL